MSKKPRAAARPKAAGKGRKTPSQKPAPAPAISREPVAAAGAAESGPRGAGSDAPVQRGSLGVSVRMYRLGVGDCFLVSFLKEDGSKFRLLIDCGIHQAESGGSDLIRKAVENLHRETGGVIDVIVATHEHWDHISGFSQAEALFRTFKVGEVWVAWTEDSDDDFAKSLKDKKRRAMAALGMAESRMRLDGREGAVNPLSGLLGFFGDTSGKSLAKAGSVLKDLAGGGRSIRYRKPGEAPLEVPGTKARIFVLGPPRDKEAIGRSDPRKGGNEVYSFGAFGGELDALEPALRAEVEAPFDARFAIPLSGTKALPFFQKRYWAAAVDEPGRERVEETQSWRRIDEDWLDSATSLALKLDEDTNNTSLVLAIELGEPDRNGPVLLFAADAQVGNWLSWQKVEWKDYKGRHITGPDLLRRTILYKVGHHASHNATLKELGLEMMDALELALVPTSAAMAEKVGWGTLPWPGLLDALGSKTGGRVIRTDRPKPKKLGDIAVIEDALFYQVDL